MRTAAWVTVWTLASCWSLTAQPFIINTVAGGTQLNNQPATQVNIGDARDLTSDSLGNLYFPSTTPGLVLKLNPVTGILYTVAGNGTSGYSGDGSAALNAMLNYPISVAVDRARNVYISDQRNYCIRVVTPDGVINTFAGMCGTQAIPYTGDNGPAKQATFTEPAGIALDSSGNLYILDYDQLFNGVLRKVTAGTNIITTVAQNLGNSQWIAIDPAGNIYVNGQCTVSRVFPAGTVVPVAGTGTCYMDGDPLGDGGSALAANLGQINGLTTDAKGTLYIADEFPDSVRSVSGGIINTVITAGPSFTTNLNTPYGLVVNAAGDLFISDEGNGHIWEVLPGTTAVINKAGIGSAGGGNATAATLTQPRGVARDNSGNLYIADEGFGTVSKVTPSGIISTYQTFFNSPSAVVADTSGNIYVAETNTNYVRVILTSGTVAVIAGNGACLPVSQNSLCAPSGLALDTAGNLYIADSGNCRVQKVSNGIITTYAGTGTCGYSNNVPATTAMLGALGAVATDANNNLYIADIDNFVVDRVDANTKVLTTIAGEPGTNGWTQDGSPALNNPIGMILGLGVDANNTVYLSDSDHQKIRTVSPAGILGTAAGTGQNGFSGDGNLANAALLATPAGIAIAPGTVYFADSQNARVRSLTSEANLISVIVNTNPPGLTIVVDGSVYSSPGVFNWESGTTHTLAGISPQGVSGGATYNLCSWSDLGPITHSVAPVSNTTYTATFSTSCLSLPPLDLGDFNSDGHPDLIWQQTSGMGQVTAWYLGGTSGVDFLNWSWLNSSNNSGWRVVAAADFNGDDIPDLVWMNTATRQVTVNYYGGPGGAMLTGWNWLNNVGIPGWSVVAVADFDGNGVPDLVWQNDTTRQVTVNYYGGAGGAFLTGWNWLNSTGIPGWKVVAAADFDGNGVPDLVWMNTTTRQVTVNYYSGPGGATLTGWNWLNSPGIPGWTVVGANDFDSNGVPDLVCQNDTTSQLTVNYYGGTGGATVIGWNWISSGGVPGWHAIVPQ